MVFVSRWQGGIETGLPTGKVVCVGRNYEEHAKELNNPIPSRPILFIKPKTALVHFEKTITIPVSFGECHHEAEIAVLISKKIKNGDPLNVPTHIGGYGVGLDLTLRALQQQLKENGHPWEVAKSFDGACPLSAFVKTFDIDSPESLSVRFDVNAIQRQIGHVSQMLHSVNELIAYMSRFFTLEAGDIIMTGTPAGVSVLSRGDRLELSLWDKDRLALSASCVVDAEII